MGNVIMAKVKLINFQMTDLSWCTAHVSPCSVQGINDDSRWHRRRSVGGLLRALAIIFERCLALANESPGRHVSCCNVVVWCRVPGSAWLAAAESSNVMGTLEAQAPRFSPTRRVLSLTRKCFWTSPPQALRLSPTLQVRCHCAMRIALSHIVLCFCLFKPSI